MANLTINRLQGYSQVEQSAPVKLGFLLSIVQAFYAPASRSEKKTSFIDAWCLSNNGQG